MYEAALVPEARHDQEPDRRNVKGDEKPAGEIMGYAMIFRPPANIGDRHWTAARET